MYHDPSGKYSFIRLLYRGSLSDVWLAKHRDLRMNVAIKVLDLSRFSDEKERFRAKKRFQREARILAFLDHPHIVRPTDFEAHGNYLFLILSYAPYGSLFALPHAGHRLQLHNVKRYIGQIGSALQYVHDAGFIHRDVKPGNILRKPGNFLLLSDFGLARGFDASDYSRMYPAYGGTRLYMAPEQALGMPCPASDQYALATMAFEWLSGRRPFNGSVEQIIWKRQHLIPPSIRALVPEIPPAIAQVLQIGLQREPDDRFATVLDFTRAFEEACQAVPVRLPYYPSGQRVIHAPKASQPVLSARHASGMYQERSSGLAQPALVFPDNEEEESQILSMPPRRRRIQTDLASPIQHAEQNKGVHMWQKVQSLINRISLIFF